MANVTNSLRSNIMELYRCGEANDMVLVCKINQQLCTVESLLKNKNAKIEKLFAENEELKKQIEALKKQDKEPEKEAPKDGTSDEEFLKAIEGFWTTLVEALTAGDSKK